MRSTMDLKMPALAVAAALGLTAFAGQADAQERQQFPGQEQQEQQECNAVLTPSTLTAPSAEQPGQEQARQRVAGEMTLQARLTEDIGKVSEVEIEEGSNVRISLAEEQGEEGEMTLEEHQEQHERERAEEHEEQHEQEQERAREQEQEEEQEQEREYERQQQEQEEEQRRQRREMEEQPGQAQNRVPLQVDISEAEEGEWEVTFKTEDGQECKGTLQIRSSGARSFGN